MPTQLVEMDALKKESIKGAVARLDLTAQRPLHLYTPQEGDP
jgi:hypothetical protein